MYLCALFSLLCFFMQTEAPGGGGRWCRNGWTTFGNSCYKVVNKNVDWETARTSCQKLFADLASLTDADQNGLVWRLARFQAPRAKYMWLGLRKNSDDGQFYWVDGMRAFYTNWASSSPNSSSDCVMMDLKGGGEWVSGPCQHVGSIIYACAVPSPSPPPPPPPPM